MFFEDLLQGEAMMNGDYADVEGATKSEFVTVDSRGKSELPLSDRQPFSFKMDESQQKCSLLL